MKLLKYFPLAKVDETTHRVLGLATAEIADHEGEICDFAGAKVTVADWSQNAFATTSAAGQDPSYGNLRAQHQLTVAGKVASPITYDDLQKQIWIDTEPISDQMFMDIKRGFYKGFSIGGDYLWRRCNVCGTDIPPEKGRKCSKCNGTVLVRYCPVVSEISYVDNPCLKQATFSLVKADGSTEQVPFASRADNFLHQLDEYHDFIKAQAAELAKYKPADSEPASVAEAPAYDLSEITKTLATQVLEHLKKSTEGDIPMDTPVQGFTAEQMTELTKSVAAQVVAKMREEEAAKLAKSVKHLAVESDGTTHLPYTDAEGKPDHHLMGSAWAALHGGYRGNKYEGPDKEKAIERLKEAYASEGLDTPDAKAEKTLKAMVKVGLLKYEKPADSSLKKYWDCCSPIGGTDMYAISQFASVLEQIYWLLQQCEWEAEFEDGAGDPADAKVAAGLHENLVGLIGTFKDMVDEGTAELVEKSDPVGLLLKSAGHGYALIDQLLATSILQ